MINQNLESLVKGLESAAEFAYKKFKKSGNEKKDLIMKIMIKYYIDCGETVTAGYKALL